MMRYKVNGVLSVAFAVSVIGVACAPVVEPIVITIPSDTVQSVGERAVFVRAAFKITPGDKLTDYSGELTIGKTQFTMIIFTREADISIDEPCNSLPHGLQTFTVKVFKSGAIWHEASAIVNVNCPD